MAYKTVAGSAVSAMESTASTALTVPQPKLVRYINILISTY